MGARELFFCVNGARESMVALSADIISRNNQPWPSNASGHRLVLPSKFGPSSMLTQFPFLDERISTSSMKKKIQQNNFMMKLHTACTSHSSQESGKTAVS
jgi:hypothetical protein